VTPAPGSATASGHAVRLITRITSATGRASAYASAPSVTATQHEWVRPPAGAVAIRASPIELRNSGDHKLAVRSMRTTATARESTTAADRTMSTSASERASATGAPARSMSTSAEARETGG